jgi:hypothetical protein
LIYKRKAVGQDNFSYIVFDFKIVPGNGQLWSRD